MLRRATTGLLSHLRPLSTAASSDDMFMEAWRRIMPNMDPPKTPLSFMHPRPTAPSPHAIPSKFTVNLVSPYSSLFYIRQVYAALVYLFGLLLLGFALEQIDPSCVQKKLEEFNQKLNSASTDMEAAEARVGIDVLTALHSALSE